MAYYDKKESSTSEKTPLLRNNSSPQLNETLEQARQNAILARKKRSATVNDADSQRKRLFPPDTAITSIPEVEDEPNQNLSIFERLRSCKVPKPVINSFLAVCTVIFMVVYIIAFPLYTGAFSAPDSGSDAYIAILLVAVWFPFIFFAQVFFIRIFIDKRVALRPKATWANLFVAGFSMATNGILLALTSIPERTPPHLQSLLQTMLIPCTVIARYVILRKGVSRSQLVCLCCLFIGLFISLEPSIFQLDGADGGSTPWYYTALFALAWLPAAVGYVFIEKGHNPEDDSMVYMAWVQVFLYSTYIFMVWVDFLPVLGMASSPMDFFHKLQRGFICLYGGDPKCTSVPKTAIAFILSYSFANMSNLLLIRYAESAVYSVVVLALVTPISTIFWTLFSPTPSLHWNPVFNSSTIYLLVGLVIMMPSVVMYSHFSNAQAQVEVQREAENTEQRRQRRKKKQRVLFNDTITVHDVQNRTTIRRVCSAPSGLMRVNE